MQNSVSHIKVFQNRAEKILGRKRLWQATEKTSYWEASWLVLLTTYYLGYHFEKDEMGEYVAHMGVKTNADTVLVGKPEGNSPPSKSRHRLGILKWISNEQVWRFRIEHGNEPLSSSKRWEFMDYRRNYSSQVLHSMELWWLVGWSVSQSDIIATHGCQEWFRATVIKLFKPHSTGGPAKNLYTNLEGTNPQLQNDLDLVWKG